MDRRIGSYRRQSQHGVGALVCKDTYLQQALYGERTQIASPRYVTRYLEEVRRGAWHRGGMINARAMEGGTPQNRKTSLEKGNPRTVRRNTVLGLGEELADRTQQRIVRRAAWDCGHFCDARSTCRVFLEGAGGGCRCRIYGHLPAVRYSKDKLSNNGE